MKTKIKRHSRSVLSVVLAISMLISCMMVGLIATDAARDDSERLGTTYNLFISTDNDPSKWSQTVTSDSQTFTITPSDLGLSNFASGTNYYVGISSSSSITGMWSQGSDGSAVVGTVSGAGISGTSANQYNANGTRYNFAHISFSSTSVSSLTVTVTHDGGSPGTTTYSFSTEGSSVADTWTAVGDNTALFGTAWAPTATANDMTTTDDNIYTWTKSNVALSAGTILYKVVQNHSWNNTSYPSSNASKTVSTAGNYNVTITYNNTSHAVDMTLTAATVTESTLSVASVANATVTATYNGTTAQEGGSISDVPEGATVTISVTPDSGYKCTGVTSSGGGTVSGSGTAWTLTMPGADTTISATTTAATKRKVYFNNYYTRYSMVSAYAWNGAADQSSITDEPLGSWPGVTMTRITNTNTWEIELYDDTEYIIFRGDDGYNTYVDTNNYYHITIPWTDQNNAPKYTAGSDKTSPTTNGTWGTYVARSNDYTVTAGSTLSASGIYSAINATFFDYYVDGEFNGDWLEDIGSDEYNMGPNWKYDPYTNFNAALSTYATNNTVTYPLYFGNLAVGNNNSLVSSYYNFYRNNNNSGMLSPTSSAVYGLAGSTLSNGAIQYASGEDMPMFDEDFLSGENIKGKALASILHSSNFPVRKTTKNVLVLDLSGADNASSTWETASAIMVANFYTSSTSSGNKYVLMTSLGDHKYSVEIPDGYTKVQWLRRNPENSTTWNSTDAGAFGSNNKYSVTAIGTDWNSVTGSWTTDSTYSAGHTYYEYDSTDGKDNAFITDINKGSTAATRTAQINYYPNSQQYVQSSGGNKGFFPFDYNNYITGGTYDTSTLKLDVTSWYDSNATQYYYAYFFGGSSGTTWKKVTGITSSNKVGTVENPGDYTNVIFVRRGTDSGTFDNKWEQTADLTVPNGSDANTTWKASSYSNGSASGSWTATSGLTPSYTTNGYADPTNHYAHDQGFGVKLEIPFTLGANGLNEDGTAQTFDFSGDDDLWVYVDDKLVLDLGGAHAVTTGSINFNTLKATAASVVAASTSDSTATGSSRTVDVDIDNSASAVNTVHTMTIYYMERGMFDSNLKFGFSFHAIPNLLNVDKKVRTANVNSGFFDATSSNKATDKNGTAYQNSQGKDITQFEHTYQGDYVSTDTGVTVPSGETLKTETFGITQGSSTAPTGGSITYSISSNSGSNSYTASNLGANDTFDYDLYNDWVAYFNGQYDEGQNITLKETIPSDSLYKYDQSFEVTNITDNNSSVSYSGDSSSGYSFDMPTTSGSGLNDLRVRARFTNQMKTHDLTISKDLNADDSTTPFTIQVLFKFGNYDYTAYKLYCVVDGANTQMNADGTITLRKNHTVTIKGIPENAQVQIKEILSYDTYAYNSTTLTGSAESQTNVAYGKQFTMGAGDVAATVRNTLGALTITHDLHTNTEGFGTCYASAKVINGSTNVYSYAETADALEISPEYIKYNSTYNLEITLRTVPANSATVMDSFWEQVTSDALAELTSSSNLGLSATVTVDKSNYTATITFPIANLFDSNTQVQNVTNMPFFSKLVTWKWRMIFDVLSYRGLYNNMQYVTGAVPFTETEWSKMTSTTSGVDENAATVDNIPDFSSDDERTNFINNHAPYENGFKTDYTWNTALKSVTGKEADMALKINNSTRTITYIVKATGDARSPVYVQYQLPYSTSYSDALNPTPDANGDVEKVDYITYGEHNDAWRTAYEGHYTISNNYVKAPQKILVSGSKTDSSDTRVYKYFSYWEVYTMETDKTSSKLYTKCYYPEFNLTLYQDSIMKAVYDNNSYVSPSDMALNDDNAATGSGTATINFMENSRTQWTADSETLRIAAADGSNVTSSYHNGGDRIYTDFLISYTYNDLQLNTSTGTGLTPGLIVETAGVLPVNETTGLYETKTQDYYEDKYSSSIDDTALKNFIANTSSKSSGNYLKSEFSLSQLDNKNRINYYYSLPNISHSTLEQTERKNKVYRAYTYLRNASGAVIVSQPVYFTIYDIASIANTADGTGYKGES